ncbi:hypothetical protein [Bartonella sp. F02]|uniref:hypothetical protein n=1 Tax=Bartonella sp. F02 TaxID=2967262 RepID=UPI0022A925A3|nr:hypothetical protein [Bartonella sp. F02]MCZ2328458.1 hypothetical protein [Bartonella sp. F02]
MRQLILLSFISAIAFYIFYALKNHLQRMLQRICNAEVKSHTDVKGTLVQDPDTGEYYIK